MVKETYIKTRQDIVAGTDATLGCFKQNSFNIHIR